MPNKILILENKKNIENKRKSNMWYKNFTL